MQTLEEGQQPTLTPEEVLGDFGGSNGFTWYNGKMEEYINSAYTNQDQGLTDYLEGLLEDRQQEFLASLTGALVTSADEDLGGNGIMDQIRNLYLEILGNNEQIARETYEHLHGLINTDRNTRLGRLAEYQQLPEVQEGQPELYPARGRGSVVYGGQGEQPLEQYEGEQLAGHVTVVSSWFVASLEAMSEGKKITENELSGVNEILSSNLGLKPVEANNQEDATRALGELNTLLRSGEYKIKQSAMPMITEQTPADKKESLTLTVKDSIISIEFLVQLRRVLMSFTGNDKSGKVLRDNLITVCQSYEEQSWATYIEQHYTDEVLEVSKKISDINARLMRFISHFLSIMTPCGENVASFTQFFMLKFTGKIDKNETVRIYFPVNYGMVPSIGKQKTAGAEESEYERNMFVFNLAFALEKNSAKRLSELYWTSHKDLGIVRSHMESELHKGYGYKYHGGNGMRVIARLKDLKANEKVYHRLVMNMPVYNRMMKKSEGIAYTRYTPKQKKNASNAPCFIYHDIVKGWIRQETFAIQLGNPMTFVQFNNWLLEECRREVTDYDKIVAAVYDHIEYEGDDRSSTFLGGGIMYSSAFPCLYKLSVIADITRRLGTDAVGEYYVPTQAFRDNVLSFFPPLVKYSDEGKYYLEANRGQDGQKNVSEVLQYKSENPDSAPKSKLPTKRSLNKVWSADKIHNPNLTSIRSIVSYAKTEDGYRASTKHEGELGDISVRQLEISKSTDPELYIGEYAIDQVRDAIRAEEIIMKREYVKYVSTKKKTKKKVEEPAQEEEQY